MSAFGSYEPRIAIEDLLQFSPFTDDMYFGAAVIESGLASLGASDSVPASAEGTPPAFSFASLAVSAGDST